MIPMAPAPGPLESAPASGRAAALLEGPAALTLILAAALLGWVSGVLWWYGPQLNDPATPPWVWPFVPDCPLFGLLGGAALLQSTAFCRWSERARRQTRWILAGAGAVALAAGLLLPAGETARAQAAMGILGGGALLLVATLPGRPLWLAAVGGILVAGQVKYGFWTLTLWGLFWRNSLLIFGTPQVSAEGLLMVAAHVGLTGMGLVLFGRLPELWRLSEGRQGRETHPARFWAVAALAVLLWFSLSDFVDYVLGFHPAVHPIVSLEAMRRSTEMVTWFFTALFLLLALQGSVAAQRRQRRGATPPVH